MSKRSAYFRRKAAEAEEQARKAATEEERTSLLDRARIWTKFAEQAEKIDDAD